MAPTSQPGGGTMHDPWRPSWEEIRAWAYSTDPEPCQDWALACAWQEGYFRDYIGLAARDDCPRRRFFLHIVYLVVGDKVRRGDAAWQVQALIEKGDGVRHPDVRRWEERSRELLAAPDSFDYFDWGAGGWSGYRTFLAPADVAPPWTAINGSAALEAEFQRELRDDHPLHGARARAIARRDDCDDVLFALEDGPAAFAVVHLTWSGKVEPDARSPAFESYETLADWRRSRMKRDHEEWSQA
jgi:hypothetical protein